MPKQNRYFEAFKEGYNAVGLASAFTLSAMLATPFPMIVGLALEAAYLLFVPDSKWYEKRLAHRFDAEVVERRRKLRDKILPLLRPEMQQRFLRLEETRQQIEAGAAQDERWFREMLRKLDYLLEKFLLFAGKEIEFRSHLDGLLEEVRGHRPYLDSQRSNENSSRSNENSSRSNDKRAARNRDDVPRRATRNNDFDLPTPRRSDSVEKAIGEVQAHFESEMDTLREEIVKEQDYNTKIVLEKRLEVLGRRLEFSGKIGKILENLEHQLQLLEDTFGLINDEVRARSPEQLISDIDEVVVASNTMTTALEEMASFEQAVARLGG